MAMIHHDLKCQSASEISICKALFFKTGVTYQLFNNKGLVLSFLSMKCVMLLCWDQLREDLTDLPS